MKYTVLLISILLYGCEEKPLGPHGFTQTDFEKGWFTVKFEYVDNNTKLVGNFQGIKACNSYAWEHINQQKNTDKGIEIKDYVCCYKQKDPECKYDFR